MNIPGEMWRQAVAMVRRAALDVAEAKAWRERAEAEVVALRAKLAAIKEVIK